MSNEWNDLISHPNHTLRIGGIEIEVHDQVFTPNPSITFSSSMILDHLPDVNGKRILDVGCGTGVVAVHCALAGAGHVTAVDISNKAINNTRINVAKHGVEKVVTVKKSDLFSKVTGQFDYIFANLPILEEVWSADTNVDNLIERFVTKYPEYLNRDGSAFFVWGSFADIAPVLALLDRCRIIFTQTSVEKLGYTWTLFELKK